MQVVLTTSSKSAIQVASSLLFRHDSSIQLDEANGHDPTKSIEHFAQSMDGFSAAFQARQIVIKN